MKTVRVQMLMEGAEVAAIDDMRFHERIGSRAEAIRQLIDRGLRVSHPGARNDDADEGLPGKPAPSASQAPATGGPIADVP